MRNKIKVRQARITDIPQLLKIDEEIWPGFRASGEMFQSRIKTFPEGQFVAISDGQVIGSVFTQLVNYKDWESRTFTWDEVTDAGTIRSTHIPNGNSVYGVGLAVAKKFQGTAASALLMIAVGRLTIQNNQRQVLLGARIPSYHKHSEMLVEEYIRATRNKGGRLLDLELAFYQRYRGKPIKLLPNYMNDPESLNFGVLMEFRNPFYNRVFRGVVAWFLKVWPTVIW